MIFDATTATVTCPACGTIRVDEEGFTEGPREYCAGCWDALSSSEQEDALTERAGKHGDVIRMDDGMAVVIRRATPAEIRESEAAPCGAIQVDDVDGSVYVEMD